MKDAIAHLRREVRELAPDVVVVFGDDQEEFHDETNMPALGVYYGEQITMGTTMRFATYQEELGDATPLMTAYAMDARHVFPGAPSLARHLIGSLLEQGFDLSASGGVGDDGVAGLGHAFGIVETQLLDEPGAIPLVPFFVNTYWPPNQSPVSRSYDLGVAVGRAIESHDEDLKVLLVASGGLSHFSTDEELDRRVLDACRAGERSALRSLEPALNGGSSEIRNWIALAAACRSLQLDWDSYIPVYRTPVGTGVGLAFAVWSTGDDDVALVHGAWQGGWTWQRVTPYLRAAGHEVLVPTLTGVGDRAPALPTGRPRHARRRCRRDARERAGRESRPRRTQLQRAGDRGRRQCAPDLIRQLAFIDAFVPDDGASATGLQPPEIAHHYRESVERRHRVVDPTPFARGARRDRPRRRRLAAVVDGHPSVQDVQRPGPGHRGVAEPPVRLHRMRRLDAGFSADAPGGRVARLAGLRAGFGPSADDDVA